MGKLALDGHAEVKAATIANNTASVKAPMYNRLRRPIRSDNAAPFNR